MEETRPRSRKFKSIFLGSLKILGYIIGICMMMPFFFNWIAVIIGIIYFLVFKGKWRLSGFMLVLATALGTNAPQRGFVEITGIYPLSLVFYTSFGLIGIFLVGLLGWALLLRLNAVQKWKENIIQKFRNINLSSPIKVFLLTLIIGAPTVFYGSISINFGVLFTNEPQFLWVHGPTTAPIGSPITLSVQSWDKFERISARYKGTVSFSIESYNLTSEIPIPYPDVILPPDYTFTGISRPSGIAYLLDNGKDNGIHQFEATINTEGIHYIKVSDTQTNNIYYSNPIIVRNSGPNIYWGDIHSHSIYSDGSGSPSHALFYAKQVACLDFFASTEHGEIITMGNSWFSKYKDFMNSANKPGEFVTFLGMEYTNHKTGHFTCIFNGTELPYQPMITSNGIETPFELWDLLDNFTLSTGSEVLALPHHTVKERYMQDWTYYNPKYVKIAEVTSTHGDCLYDQHHPLSYRGATVAPPKGTRGASITDALMMGLNISLYASSDGHDGHPGHTLSHTKARVAHQRPFTPWWTRIDKPYPGGLTAVYTLDLTRASVFSKLQNRSIYANSDHGRPFLELMINGRSVGGNSTLVLPDLTTQRNLTVWIAQDGAPASGLDKAASVTSDWEPEWDGDVEILKNGKVLASIPITNPYEIIEFQDNTVVNGTEYTHCVNVDGENYINSYSDNPVNPLDLNSGGRDFYIIRIVGDNGRHSYIGPIWVTSA